MEQTNCEKNWLVIYGGIFFRIRSVTSAGVDVSPFCFVERRQGVRKAHKGNKNEQSQRSRARRRCRSTHRGTRRKAVVQDQVLVAVFGMWGTTLGGSARYDEGTVPVQPRRSH